MRLYHLVRDEDVSGVSGTGLVAEAVLFDSGKVAVSFLLRTAEVPNVIVYDSLSDCVKIHGHGGRTRLVPLTPDEPASREPAGRGSFLREWIGLASGWGRA